MEGNHRGLHGDTAVYAAAFAIDMVAIAEEEGRQRAIMAHCSVQCETLRDKKCASLDAALSGVYVWKTIIEGPTSQFACQSLKKFTIAYDEQ